MTAPSAPGRLSVPKLRLTNRLRDLQECWGRSCCNLGIFPHITMSNYVNDESSIFDDGADIEKNNTVVATLPLADFDDPNLDNDAAIAGILEDDSPYPEVRSAVANTDDETIYVGTLRSWVLGILCAIIFPGLNQFYFFRYPGVTILGLVAQLITFPLGRAWAKVMPKVKILDISVNPGPFTVKEHVLITIMASVGAQSAYATGLIAVQRVYYSQNYSFIHQWMAVMSTQLIGFSMGGIARRFLVQPPSMSALYLISVCSLCDPIFQFGLTLSLLARYSTRYMRSNTLGLETAAVFLESDFSSIASQRVSSGTSSLVTFSKLSVISRGYAGLCPTISPSTRCSVISMVWGCL